MNDGLYKVEFQVAGKAGNGVVMLEDGILRGGDCLMYYLGLYSMDGERITADVTLGTHTEEPGETSVFGLDRVHIRLEGKVTGDSAVLSGTSRAAPAVPLQAMLSRIAD
ncbi:MAG TPA: GrlR family regulatory protein [Bryobacteraceae bacterium]|nr:GrlR family regulatory protein [Bryobacteraceae bacterium]